MEFKNFFINIITILSFIILIFFDIFNISNYINYSETIESTITNMITFASILIGFISTIYVMIQQDQNSYVFKLLQKSNLIEFFNNSFKHFIYTGFIDVIALICLNFFDKMFIIFKYIFYFALPLTIYFLLISNNLVVTLCKIIISENKLKNKEKKVEEKNIKL